MIRPENKTYTFLLGLVVLLVVGAIADPTTKEEIVKEQNQLFVFVNTPYYSHFRYIDPLETAPVVAAQQPPNDPFAIVRHRFPIFGGFNKRTKMPVQMSTTTPEPSNLVSGIFAGFSK